MKTTSPNSREMRQKMSSKPTKLASKLRLTLNKVKSIQFRKAFRHKSTMKFCLLGLLLGLLLVVLFYSQEGEAKKIKIKLKDLKKLKKYGYLLAGQSKKTYAIPFPVPLPVFIKRQQIYTQVPVVPRYIHQAPSYHMMANEVHSDSYGSPSSYMPEMKMASMDPYGSASSGMMPMSMGMDTSRYVLGGAGYPMLLGGGARGKYMSPLSYSTLLGGMSSGSPQRELVNKLLTGQARVLSPKSLLNSLKSQPMVKQLAAELVGSSGGSTSGGKHSSSSSSSSSSDSASSESSSGNSTSPASSSKESGAKTAASEQYLNMLRPPSPYHHLHGHHQARGQPHYHLHSHDRQVVARVPRAPRHLMAAHRHPAHYPALYPAAGELYRLSPHAAYLTAAASRPIPQAALIPARLMPLAAYPNPMASELLMQQLLQQQQAMAAADQTQQQLAELSAAASAVEPNASASSLESSAKAAEIQEPEASGSQDYEATLEGANTGAAKLTAQQQRENQLMAAVQRQRRQVALRMAILARERDQAQVAESQALLLRAHQMGLPVVSRQARLVNF